MQGKFRPVFVLGGSRTPFFKSFTRYAKVPLPTLLTASLEDLVHKYNLEGRQLGDVALGALMKSAAHWNLARECVLGSGLSAYTPAYDLQRACGTSLEASLHIALKIAASQIESGIAGGADTNSDLPIELPRSFGKKLIAMKSSRTLPEKLKSLVAFTPKDLLPQIPGVVEPRTGLSMGQHCEKMVQEWKIPRETQDQLAFKSHQTGSTAYDEGFYSDLVFSFQGATKDGTLRKDTSLEKLATLKPAFDPEKGSLTAGNSSPLTDGSAAVLLGSENFASSIGREPWARFVDAEVAAIDFVGGEGLLMAPTKAVAQLIARNNLKLQDFDIYEIHEAFAGQVLCTLKAWEDESYCKEKMGFAKALGPIDQTKMNLKGGSVALGHPFAATGARTVASLAKMLKGKRGARGLISICTAGGMGVAAILEGV